MFNDSTSRIVSQLRAWIEISPPGTKLPATRSLVQEHAVSPQTVQKALRILDAEGLIETRPGAGTFVRKIRTVQHIDYNWQIGTLGAMHKSPMQLSHIPSALQTVPNDIIPFHSGYIDAELLPVRQIRAAFARAARTEASISRAPTAGLPQLQSWFAAELAAQGSRTYNPPTAKDVIIIPGSQSGISTAFRALVGTGRPLIVESPTYWGALLAAAQAGVEVIPIPSGIDGPDIAELSRVFEQTKAKAFYAQPNFSNPAGNCWSENIAQEVIELAHRNNAFIIEDDWAHDFGFTHIPLPLAARDDRGHIVYLRSLTKSVSPSLRVAGLVARGPVRDRLLTQVQAENMYVSQILQAVALDVITQPSWKTHLRVLQQQLKDRRDLLVSIIYEYAPLLSIEHMQQGGLNLWVQLPNEINVERCAADCYAKGVAVSPGNEWFPTEPSGAYFRLNFSGGNPANFARGVQIIQAVVEHNLRGCPEIV